MPKPTLPAKDRAVLASHEAGMHDRKPRPDTCRSCAEDAAIVAGAVAHPETASPAKPRRPKAVVVDATTPIETGKPERKPRVRKAVSLPLDGGETVELTLNDVLDGTVPPVVLAPDVPAIVADMFPETFDAPALPTFASVIEDIAAGPMPLYLTREAWMQAAIETFRPWLTEAGADVPAGVRVSVGWPGGRGNKQHVVGQCWMASAVADRIPMIFVSPVQDNPIDVLETILHELIHAAGNHGHRGAFRKVGLALGFLDPMTASPASEELKARLAEVAEKLGPYGHSRIIARDTLGATIIPGAGVAAGEGELAPPPVQGTRMIKAACRDCGYTVRLTRKWIAVAVPQCPVHHLDMDIEEKGEMTKRKPKRILVCGCRPQAPDAVDRDGDRIKEFCRRCDQLITAQEVIAP